MLFAAAMSSVIGSTYTSATFLKTLHKSLNERSNLIVIVFIVISTMIFLFIGKPISLLIIAGAINGWILPITLGAILIASKKKSIVGDDTLKLDVHLWYRCSTCYNIDRYILIQKILQLF